MLHKITSLLKPKISTTGRLDSPSNLNVDIVNDSLSLSWTPPYTIEGIYIHYYTEIHARFLNGTVFMVYLNTTSKESLSTKGLDNSTCTVYETCVQAISAGGLGEAACSNKSRIGGKLYYSILLIQNCVIERCIYIHK